MNRIAKAFYLGQALGWGNLPRRIVHALKTRLGLQARLLPGGELSPAQWRCCFVDDYQAADATQWARRRAERMFIGPAHVEGIRAALATVVSDDQWTQRVAAAARDLRAGRMMMFNHRTAEVGNPPRYNRNPIHGIDWPTGRHWSAYNSFDPALKDIKCVWEASRFSWAYLLARQHIRDPQSPAAELYWSWFDAWDMQNPYGLTPLWMCGQEATFRLMAWLFAAAATIDHPAATAARLHRLTQLVWYTGRHIERNIGYARGQKNNHAISEAVGLWTIGVLFPELRSSPRWRDKGRRILAAELGRQIAPDGSYVQHSVNYHRVMLDDVLWAAALSRSAGDPLPDAVPRQTERALAWLLEMIDPASGACPNYGANDGALVLPLDTCDYTDYRPAAQAVHYFVHGRRCFARGPWDEKLLWLFGPAALEAPQREHERAALWRADAGGYYAFRGPRSWAMTRCHSFRDRPSHADMLHLDLWFGGHNVLRDGGSYHYFCEQPWHSYFKSTAAHNTVEIDRQDQMIAGPRFTWLRWVRARLIRCATSADGRVSWFEGEHFGYTRLPGRPIHRRAIGRIDDTYIVIDDVFGDGVHEVAQRWRLYPTTWVERDGGYAADIDGCALQVAVHVPEGFETTLRRGQQTPRPEGWESRYYADKQPVPTLVATGRPQLPVRLVTLIGQAAAGISVADAGVSDGPVCLAGLMDEHLAAALTDVSARRIRIASK